MLHHFSHVQLSETPWTVACQASLFMGFSRQEYWSGLPCPAPGNLPYPGVEPLSLLSPALAGGFFTTSTTWEAQEKKYITVIKGKGMCLEVRESLDWSLNELTFLGKLFEMGIRRVPTSFFCYSYHRNNWEEPLHMILSTQWAFSKCSLHLPLPLFPIMFFLQGNESDSFFEDFMIQYFLDLLNHSHIFDYRILFIIQTLLSWR